TRAPNTSARIIRVRKPGATDAQSLVLPIRGLDTPFADVALEGGETIEVERWETNFVTVVGLVNTPGAYTYPQGVRYTLMQAIALAGGADKNADPPYATVLRADANGKIIPVTFGITGEDMLKAITIAIRPGDVVAVEHTPGTWVRTFLKDAFSFQIGIFIN